MKRRALTLAAVVLLTLPALAQPAAAEEDVFVQTQGEEEYLAKDFLLTLQVQNADGQIIGDIEDLILDANNQVVGVVMGVGGFAGFGEKRVGVRLSALQIKNDDGTVTIVLPQATQEKLDALEPFKRSKPPKSLLDRAISKAKELTDKGSVTAKDAYDKAKEDAGPAIEKAKQTAKEVYEDVKEKAAPALEQAQEAAKDAYNKAREAVENPPADTESSTSEGASSADTATPPETSEPATQP